MGIWEKRLAICIKVMSFSSFQAHFYENRPIFQYILLNFGPKMPVLKVETTLHVFLLFLMIFRISFWHSHYSRACKNAENCRKSVKKTANFNGFLAIFNIFGTPDKVWISKSDPKKTEFSTISYKKTKKLNFWRFLIKKNYKTQFLMISYKKRNLKTGILYMVSGGLGVYHIMVVYVMGYLISVE